MPDQNGTAEHFEPASLSSFLDLWRPAGNSHKNAAPLSPATAAIPPRIRISERVFVGAVPVRLKAVCLPAWMPAARQAQMPKFPHGAEPSAPRARVWVRTWTGLRQGLGVSGAATVWAQLRNSYVLRQKLRPMDPLMPAAADPTFVFASRIVGQIPRPPMARTAASLELGHAGGLAPGLPTAKANAIACNPSEVSLPGALQPASLQPGLAFTGGFRTSFQNPNSYSRRSQPCPRLTICEQVTFPRSQHPVSLSRTIKESDTPADQEIEIYQPRHAHQPA